MANLANSEVPDEIPHNAVFHQCLHCLLRQNQSSGKEIQYFLEIIACDPSIYGKNHPDFIVCSFMGHPIGLKRVNKNAYHVDMAASLYQDIYQMYMVVTHGSQQRLRDRCHLEYFTVELPICENFLSYHIIILLTGDI